MQEKRIKMDVNQYLCDFEFDIIFNHLHDAKLMHSWGFALREGVFAETKEGKCKNKREKS